jgi:hypothetical protein
MKSKRRYLLFTLALFVSVILSGCDPNGLPYLAVNRVVIKDNTPYLLVLERCSWGVSCPSSEQNRYFTSSNEGKTWQELSSPPLEMQPAIESPGKYQAITCVPQDSRICYRVTGGEQVDFSNDGGQTWQIDWHQPIGRKTYMERDKLYTMLLHVVPDTAPYSIGIIQNKDKYIVIAALGNQGVLVKSENGSWDRYAVSPSIPSSVPDYAMPSNTSRVIPASAAPIAYAATSIDEIKQSLNLEILRILLTAMIFFMTLSIFRWRRVRSDKGKTNNLDGSILKHRTMFIGGAFLICLLQFIVIFIYPKLPLSFFENINIVFFVLINFPFFNICLITILGLIVSWILIGKIPKNQAIEEHELRIDIGYGLLLLLGAFLPLVLWSIGIIPIFEISMIFSLILGSIVIFFGFRNKWLIASSTTQQSNNLSS